MKIYRLLVFLCLCALVAGCADIEVPKTENLLKEPLGGGSLKIGMTKDQVVDLYGDPVTKSMVTSAEWNEPREEWFYRATYSALPVGAGHLSEDLYLYFDGENLTTISRKPLGAREEKDAEENIK